MPASVAEVERYETTVSGPAGGDPRTAKSVRDMGTPLASRSLWLRKRLEELTGVFVKVTAVDAGANTFTSSGHPFGDDDPVRVISIGGGLPGNVVLGTIYYIKVIDANTVQISDTVGGATFDISTAGSGTIYLVRQIDAAAALFSPVSGVLPAGSLREQLTYLRDNYGRKAANNTWTGVNSFAGVVATSEVLLTGAGALLLRRDRAAVADQATVNLDYTAEAYNVPDVSQTTTINLPAPLAGGRLEYRFRRKAAASGFAVLIKYSGTLICTPPGAGSASFADVQTVASASWETAFAGGATTVTT